MASAQGFPRDRPLDLAWDYPLVLTLDGGGVRGLSSLFILREIMRAIQAIDSKNSEADQIENSSNGRLPLPCHYFDFIIGTSTGGLIAIMLGRLRMGVNECIKEYWCMSLAIFKNPPIRPLHTYPCGVVQQAAKEVTRRNCSCRPGAPCTTVSHSLLRQYDYKERPPNGHPQANWTCKVGVTTVREGGRNAGHHRAQDMGILFRSYDHGSRLLSGELNPKTLQASRLTIDQACGCTTSAPTYFRPTEIGNRLYVDGAVLYNNPAEVAWNEAVQMARSIDAPNQRGAHPKVFVSIGTGKRNEISGFGWLSLIKKILRRFTDTENVHERMLVLPSVQDCTTMYYRFNVPETTRNFKGLSHIKLDECKKRRRPQPLPKPSIRQLPGPEGILQGEATETRRGGYKPYKYEYITFDDILNSTMQYCQNHNINNEDVPNRITECAKWLIRMSVARKSQDQARWCRWRRHPDPSNPRGE